MGRKIVDAKMRLQWGHDLAVMESGHNRYAMANRKYRASMGP